MLNTNGILNPLRGITPQRQTILLVKGRALVIGWLIRLSAHVSSYPLSRIVPQCALHYYFAMSIKAMLHGAIFLATCNAILLLRDVN